MVPAVRGFFRVPIRTVIDYKKADDLFGLYFGLDLREYTDLWQLTLLGETHLDLFKFDEIMHTIIGRKHYPADGVSLREAIMEHYGRAAAELVEALL